MTAVWEAINAAPITTGEKTPLMISVSKEREWPTGVTIVKVSLAFLSRANKPGARTHPLLQGYNRASTIHLLPGAEPENKLL